MATTNHTGHSLFDESFSQRTRQELLDEDHFAWQSVCSVLIAIVSFGLALGAFAVMLSLYHQS